MFTLRRWAIAGLLAAGLLVPGVRAVSARQDRPAPSVVYVVHPGDTLWRIARRVPGGGDVRARVQRILELNDLGSAAILPGQKLRLPLR